MRTCLIEQLAELNDQRIEGPWRSSMEHLLHQLEAALLKAFGLPETIVIAVPVPAPAPSVACCEACGRPAEAAA